MFAPLKACSVWAISFSDWAQPREYQFPVPTLWQIFAMSHNALDQTTSSIVNT